MAGYGDDAGFAAWMAENGYVLPDGAPSPAVLRQRGSDLVDALYGNRFTGQPADPLQQERAWPRIGATAFGVEVPGDLVPLAVITASYHAALSSASMVPSLMIPDPSRIKRDKVGDTETEFRDGASQFASGSDVPVTILDGLLAPLLTVPTSLLLRSVGCRAIT